MRFIRQNTNYWRALILSFENVRTFIAFLCDQLLKLMMVRLDVCSFGRLQYSCCHFKHLDEKPKIIKTSCVFDVVFNLWCQNRIISRILLMIFFRPPTLLGGPHWGERGKFHLHTCTQAHKHLDEKPKMIKKVMFLTLYLISDVRIVFYGEFYSIIFFIGHLPYLVAHTGAREGNFTYTHAHRHSNIWMKTKN